MMLIGILQGPTLLLDLRLHLAFLVKDFLVGRIFFWKSILIGVKKLLQFSAISIGLVILLSSAIMADILLPSLFFLDDLTVCIP